MLQRNASSPGDIVALTEADGDVEKERIDDKRAELLLLLATRLGDTGWLAEPVEEMDKERTSAGILEFERFGEDVAIALEELVDETLFVEGVELCEALRLDDWVSGGVKDANAVASGDGMADPLVERLCVTPGGTVVVPLTVVVRVTVLVVMLFVGEDVSLLDAVLAADAVFDGLSVDVTVRLWVELVVEDIVRLDVSVCAIVAETDWEGEQEGDVDRVEVPIDEPVCEPDGVSICVAVAGCERVKVSEADVVSDGLALPLGVPDGLGVGAPLEVWVDEGVST